MKSDQPWDAKNHFDKSSCRDYLDNLIFESSVLTDPNEVGLVGIELEVFPYCFDKNRNIIPVSFEGSEMSLKSILTRVCEAEKAKCIYEENPSAGELLLKKIEFPNGDNFQFEPGGQIEIIINPCKSLLDLEARLKFKKSILKKITDDYEVYFAQHGTNPFFDTEEVGLQVPKTRYLHLQNYLDQISIYGRKMMRLTGSLQVNLDHGLGEEIRVRRIIAANLLSPIATAIFSNSSISNRKKNGLRSFRSFIWQNLDNKRTGIIAPENSDEKWNREKIVQSYLEFSLQAPVIHTEKISPNISFEDWLLNGDVIKPELDDYIQHISLLFPEVRLRKYLELRSIDAPPEHSDIVPVYFYTGLLYNNSYLNRLLSLLVPLQKDINSLWKESVHGLENDQIFDVAKKIMKLAIEGFETLPSTFRSDAQLDQLISFNQNYTSKRRSFADDAADYFQI